MAADRPNLPRKGTAARKIYDCIEGSREGLTAFEVERVCGAMKNLSTRFSELRDKGLIEVVGKRDVEGVKNLDIWGVKSAKDERKKKRHRMGHVPKQELDPYECPACGKTVYMLLVHPDDGGGCIYVEKQRRLIVFDGPWIKQEYVDSETGEKKVTELPKEPITLFEEHTGKLVLGRAATEAERAHYAEHKKLRVPWTIGFENHLKTCKGMKRWLNGKAEEKRRTWEVKWDKSKRRYGFSKREEKKKSMMKDAFTDELPTEIIDPKD